MAMRARIIDRMQRHFCTLATPFPEAQVLSAIYTNIMTGHFDIFSSQIKEALPMLISCAVAVHMQVADAFVPSAVKFHYQWNLRALASVFQGLVNTSPATYKQPLQICRLYLHEATRVYGDRMVSESDVERFVEILVKNAKAYLGELDQVSPPPIPPAPLSPPLERHPRPSSRRSFSPIRSSLERL